MGEGLYDDVSSIHALMNFNQEFMPLFCIKTFAISERNICGAKGPCQLWCPLTRGCSLAFVFWDLQLAHLARLELCALTSLDLLHSIFRAYRFQMVIPQLREVPTSPSRRVPFSLIVHSLSHFPLARGVGK